MTKTNNIKLSKYRVAYRDEADKMKYKVITAKSNAAALIRFKHLTGIKGIYAKYVLPKSEEKTSTRASGRPAYFDGRAWCYCDNDCVVGAEDGYSR